jgi:hypothetical protein
LIYPIFLFHKYLVPMFMYMLDWRGKKPVQNVRLITRWEEISWETNVGESVILMDLTKLCYEIEDVDKICLDQVVVQ